MFNSQLCSFVWMGDLDEDLDEQAIISIFSQLGEFIVSVKMNKNPLNSGSNYCFVEFASVDFAQKAIQRLNQRAIPGKPGKKFKLNPASYGRARELLPEFSLFVSDLSWNVDDYQLFEFFQRRYLSVRGAKVVLDHNGSSKGFGFVRFSEENDQQRALIEMQHMTGLGRRPIKVSLASLKRRGDSTSSVGAPSTGHASNNTNNYSWGGYSYHYTQSYPQHSAYNSEYGVTAVQYPDNHEAASALAEYEDDSEVLEDPDLEINVGKENREFIESSESFFMELEKSRWMPLDDVMSEVPDCTID